MDGYPKVKFHLRGGGSICAVSPEQEKALGPEWIDNRPPQAVAALPALTVSAQEPIKRRGRPPKVKNEGS